MTLQHHILGKPPELPDRTPGFCWPRKLSRNLQEAVLAVAAGFALGGCATAPKPDTPFLARPLTVRLVEVPIRDREAVRRVVAPEHSKDPLDAEQETRQAIEAAQSGALADMAGAFTGLPNMRMSSASSSLPAPLDGFPILERKAAIAPDVLAALRDASQADALLRFGISDYGLTPKAWRRGVIAFEVVSTLGVAAIAYARPATRAIAGAYLAQEAVEETLEAYSGFWALDEVFRPVRVEAELIDLQTGRTAWADSETGFSDRRVSRLYTPVTPAERDAQLSAALHEAITKVMQDFAQCASRWTAPAAVP